MSKFERKVSDMTPAAKEDSERVSELEKENEELRALIKKRTSEANETIVKLAQMKKAAEDEAREAKEELERVREGRGGGETGRLKEENMRLEADLKAAKLLLSQTVN